MDRITAMSAFVRVVEAGNFSKAADSLDVPRPTITRLVQGLEAELGVRLLQRTTRSVTVTMEGASYYEGAVRLLADMADLEATAKQSLARPSGRIRVEAAVALGTQVIIPALPAFYEQYPGIELDLGIGNRSGDLIAEGIDCALRVGEISEQSLVARRIGEFEFVTCATCGYLAAHGTPLLPSDLNGGHDLLGMVSPENGRPLPFLFMKDGERVEIESRPRLVLNDTNAYLAAGLAGLGLIHAPAFAVRGALGTGSLVAVLEDWQTPVIPVHVVYAPNRFLTAKVRVFIDWTIALLERNSGFRVQ